MNTKTIAKMMCLAGKELEQNGSNAGPVLRSLQSQLHSAQRLNQQTDFLCYFVSNFIDDVFYNLTGDFPYYKESHDIIGNMFKGFGNALSLLGDSLKNDAPACNLPYESLIKIYLDGLEKIQEFCDSLECKSN